MAHRAILHHGLDAAQLIIFDKDGTLIDFHAMWSAWITALARRLEAAAGLSVREQLFRAVGFDPSTRHIAPAGLLAIGTMAELRAEVSAVLREHGLEQSDAEAVTSKAWFVPDPVALAQPLADLPHVFRALREHGIKLAIATTDDRRATLATIHALGIAPYIDALACGDDGLPIKPAPDMIVALCRQLDVDPRAAVMVGDTIADLHMGRAAGAGVVIGVLGGVGTREMLMPLADLVVSSVAELVAASA